MHKAALWFVGVLLVICAADAAAQPAVNSTHVDHTNGQVVLLGRQFGQAPVVRFDGYPLAIQAVGETFIVLALPNGLLPGSYLLSIHTPTGATATMVTYGTSGPAGPRGQDGAAGPVGPAGPQGAAGAQGPPGATGPQGQSGDIGPQGVQGIPGPPGSQGLQGVQGPPGQAGAAGTTGAPGTNGVSGYERVSFPVTCPTSSACFPIHSCPAGKRVLSGGIELTNVTGNDLLNVAIRDAYPTSNTSWQTRVTNVNAFDVTYNAWLVCITAP